MSMEWWRCKHGAPFDPKWRAVALRAQSRAGDVWAVFTTLCDRASQASDRGSIEGVDLEDVAAGLGYELEEVQRIFTALKARGLVTDERVAKWEIHQPKREDISTERVRAHRNAMKRTETQSPPRERVDTDTDTDTEKKPEREREARPALKAEPPPKPGAVPQRQPWPVGAVVPEKWVEHAEAERRRLRMPPLDLPVVATKFVAHYQAEGNARSQTEWEGKWIKFVLSETVGKSNGSPAGGQHGQPSRVTRIVGEFIAESRARSEADSG